MTTETRKLHKHPYPSVNRTDNNSKQTKGRIKMGARVQNIPVFEKNQLGKPTGQLLGYIHQYHSNRLK